MNWIQKVIDSTEELEAPKNYYYWAALSVLASTVKGRVYLDRFGFRLYPNIYVLLLGSSGLRKSSVINFAKKLAVLLGNNRVIAGRNTIEAILNKLSKDFTQEKGGIVKNATGFLLASEFSTFIQQNDEAMTILTDLYDAGYHDDLPWENSLKTSGVEKLRGVNLTMLGASNIPHLREILQTRDIEGGFVARTALIHDSEKRTINSLVYKPKRVIDYDALLSYLDILRELEGEFHFTEKSGRFFDDWYNQYNKITVDEEADKTGTSARFEDHVLKIAMLLSLSKRTDLILKVEDIEEAIHSCFNFRKTAERLMIDRKEDKPQAKVFRIVLQILLGLDAGEYISRAKILKRTIGDISSFELDKFIDDTRQAGLTEIKQDGSAFFLKLSDEYYKKIKGAK